MFTYDPFHVKLQKEGDSDILNSELYKPFKDALLRSVRDKMHENGEHIFHNGTKNDEERGKYMGVVMVYEDLTKQFTKQEVKEKPAYRDAYHKAEELVKKLFKKPKTVKT